MGVGFGIWLRIRQNLKQLIRYSAELQKSGFGVSLNISHALTHAVQEQKTFSSEKVGIPFLSIS